MDIDKIRIAKIDDIFVDYPSEPPQPPDVSSSNRLSNIIAYGVPACTFGVSLVVIVIYLLKYNRKIKKAMLENNEEKIKKIKVNHKETIKIFIIVFGILWPLAIITYILFSIHV